MVFSVFNTSWTEQVVLHYKDDGGPEYICHMFDRMIAFFGSFAIGIIACIPFIYNILIPNNEYSEAYGLIPFYMIAVFFNAVIGLISAIYAVENETKKAAMTTVVAAVINIGTDILLIGSIDIYAAPISSICGYVVISMWRLIDVNNRHCKIYMKKEKISILLGMLVVTLISYWNDNLFVKLGALVVTFIGALVLNNSILKVFIDILMKRVKQNFI